MIKIKNDIRNNIFQSYLWFKIESIFSWILHPISIFKKPKDYLSIVAVIKNEAPYIQEWIEFHKMMGVSRFYLYDAATDNTNEILKPYIDSGEVIYKKCTGKMVQMPAYNNALFHYRFKTRWLAIIDADEFITPVEEPQKTIPEFLKEYEIYPGIGINWILYDSNGHINKPIGLVLKNYTRVHKNDDEIVNRFVKTIVNPRKVYICPNPHFCIYYKALTYAIDERKTRHIYGHYSIQNSTNKIRVSHYVSKSKEEYIKKCKRGNADSNKHRVFDERDYNFQDTKEDTTMLKYVPYLEKKLNERSNSNR